MYKPAFFLLALLSVHATHGACEDVAPRSPQRFLGTYVGTRTSKTPPECPLVSDECDVAMLIMFTDGAIHLWEDLTMRFSVSSDGILVGRTQDYDLNTDVTFLKEIRIQTDGKKATIQSKSWSEGSRKADCTTVAEIKASHYAGVTDYKEFERFMLRRLKDGTWRKCETRNRTLKDFKE